MIGAIFFGALVLSPVSFGSAIVGAVIFGSPVGTRSRLRLNDQPGVRLALKQGGTAGKNEA
jgi:hypothetical protein